MMRKRNNSTRNRSDGRNNNGGGQHNNGGRRYHNNAGGNRANDGQNLQRQKHHATQQREKFMNLARDAQNHGDRVDVEYYLQHVDHYGRVLADIALVEAERHSHQREHYSQPANTESRGATQSDGGDGAHAPASVQEEGTGEALPVETHRQPRMSQRGGRQQSYGQARPPRHSQQEARHNAPDGGAAAALGEATDHSGNAGGEIPLPGSIISAI